MNDNIIQKISRLTETLKEMVALAENYDASKVSSTFPLDEHPLPLEHGHVGIWNRIKSLFGNEVGDENAETYSSGSVTATVEGKPTFEFAESGKDDIDLMLECCFAELKNFRDQRLTPAPFYFWRVAVLLAKAKRYQDEANILEAFLPFTTIGIGQRYDDLAKRLPKALARASKANQSLTKTSGIGK